MRENVARGVGGIARDDERPEQYVVTEDDQDECEEAGDSCHFCCDAL